MQPTKIQFLQKPRQLHLYYDNDEHRIADAYHLRMHSPAADHRHQPEQVNEMVNITSIEAVGQYAVKIVFDDGHQTGIYSWETLYKLSQPINLKSD